MIDIKQKKDCCGCSACAQVCPRACIRMEQDAEGFSYPGVSKEQSVQCGLCEKVCPILHAGERTDQVLKTYIGYYRQLPVRMASSSGGIFTLLAKQTLAKGGKVYGAAFDEHFTVFHTAASNEAELAQLQGSKYLQSRMGQTFQNIREDLKRRQQVLFSGTACQVAGLRSFLRRDYDGLLTVDVLCHGVPSPVVWETYLRELEQEYQSRVSHVFFRKKELTGWKRYELDITFENGASYHRPFPEDPYMRLFLHEICLRPSCHDCRFKRLERPSDITIGDCWGVERYMPELDDDKGTSVVIIHTPAGMEQFEAIAPEMAYKEAETDRALPPTADSRKSVLPHRRREAFFRKLPDATSLKELVPLIEPSFADRVKRKLRNIRNRIVHKGA